MRILVYSFIVFFTHAVCAEPIELKNIYSHWQTFQKDAKVADLGVFMTDESISLYFGESSNGTYDDDLVKIVSNELKGNVHKITIEFPPIGSKSKESKTNSEYTNELIWDLKKKLLSNKDYTLEVYGVESKKNGERPDPKLFGIAKFQSPATQITALKKNKNLKIPGMVVDIKKKTVTIDAKVCLNEGILEYLMCLPNSYEHESILLTKLRPEILHAGLLLIGRDPLPRKNRKIAMTKDNSTHRLKIEVEWLDLVDGKQKVSLHKLLIDRSGDKKKMAKDKWYFAGSHFTPNNVYAANIHLSIISLQQHPASVIHYGDKTLDPYKSARGGFKVNSELCPPMDTEVKLIFSIP